MFIGSSYFVCFNYYNLLRRKLFLLTMQYLLAVLHLKYLPFFKLQVSSFTQSHHCFPVTQLIAKKNPTEDITWMLAKVYRCDFSIIRYTDVPNLRSREVLLRAQMFETADCREFPSLSRLPLTRVQVCSAITCVIVEKFWYRNRLLTDISYYKW